MTERWKAWKTKSRFSTLPSAPWKSRKGGEIPTFPQVLLPLPLSQQNRGRRKNNGLWKSGNPKAGFPLSHSPESCLRRKEEDHQKTTERSSFSGHCQLPVSCSSCIGTEVDFMLILGLENAGRTDETAEKKLATWHVNPLNPLKRGKPWGKSYQIRNTVSNLQQPGVSAKSPSSSRSARPQLCGRAR